MFYDNIKIKSKSDPEVRIALRLRSLSGPNKNDGQNVVLFVHGATLASCIWDIPIPGQSWLNYVAQRYWNAAAIDIQGYGSSGAPHCVERLGQSCKPFSRATDAIHDIDSAVEYLRTLYGVDQITIVGASWGTITTALYATTIGRGKVKKLVLYAPIFSCPNEKWLEMIRDPQDHSRPNPALEGFRWVTSQQVRERWDEEIPVADKQLWRSEQTFKELLGAALDADSRSLKDPVPAFCAPNGTLLDLFEAFSERALWDPKNLDIPTLLIRGDVDPTSTHEDASGLFKLIQSSHKRYVVIGNGAHFVFAERNARQVFREVQLFLDEKF